MQFFQERGCYLLVQVKKDPKGRKYYEPLMQDLGKQTCLKFVNFFTNPLRYYVPYLIMMFRMLCIMVRSNL